jgi:hypothetical protein
MPSWENVEEAINFTVQPQKGMHPELFAASRQAKAMPYDQHGRQSVQYITDLQFPQEEPDVRKLNRALKNLCDDLNAAKPEVPGKVFFEEAPPPPPTDAQLHERAARERCDIIGHLKPAALVSRSAWGEQSISEWLTSSVVNVKARGGVLQYPPTQHAYSHRPWYGGVPQETQDDSVLARSLFRARNLAERRSLQARPQSATGYQGQNLGGWGGQWDQFVPRGQFLPQRDWRYPRDLSVGARSKDAPFDINEFFATSVFKSGMRREVPVVYSSNVAGGVSGC